MQTYWSGEYQRFNSFLAQVGIVHQASCHHAHQQNGSTKRKHRHIVEIGLVLLAHASIPLKFWDEAFLAIVYLINRMPSKTIQNSTPLDCLFKQKPDYSSRRTFSCACCLTYVHTIHTSFNFAPSNVSSLILATCTKVSSV